MFRDFLVSFGTFQLSFGTQRTNKNRLKNQIVFTKSVKKLNCIDDLIYITTTSIFGCIDVDYLSHYQEIYLDEYIQVIKH